MTIDIMGHRERFLAFVENYVAGAQNGPLRLKVEHSFRVLEHAELLATTELSAAPEAADQETARAALLAALYHDCGRFPQFRDYHTFMDAQSVDHAQLGVDVIRVFCGVRRTAYGNWSKRPFGCITDTLCPRT